MGNTLRYVGMAVSTLILINGGRKGESLSWYQSEELNARIDTKVECGTITMNILFSIISVSASS